MAKAEILVSETQDLPDGVVAGLYGEIDFGRSPALRQQLMAVLQQKKPARLVLDLTAVPYMDSSGVATLIEILQAQRRLGARLVLFGLQPKVRGIFEIARLNSVFTIAGDVESAKKA